MADFRMRGFQGIPPVIKNLVIANVLFFLAELTFGGQFIETLSLHYYDHPEFHFWQLASYMFMHAGWEHILFNMLALWMFGSTVEDVWGGKRFLIFYLICGIGAALFQVGTMAVELQILTSKVNAGSISQEEFLMRGRSIYNLTIVGASGAINGVMAAFAYLFPNAPMFLFFIPVPVKAKYIVIGYFLLDLFGGINPGSGDNVAHFAHVGGAIVGLILVITMNRTNRRTFY
ncbi:rhomboid family intramembrane serine protease [Niastella vici]|nr:rhomboid family intramembrane serine protease [Niastella vici]